MLGTRLHALRLLILLLLISWPVCLRAQSEYGVKAAYLFNVMRFVSWKLPVNATQETPIRLCIHGDDPFGDHLQPMHQLKVRGHPINIVQTHKLQELAECNAVFISRSETRSLEQILQKTNGRPILTVSDLPNFTLRGGMIGFTLAGNVIRFNIDLLAVRANGLDISAKLLRLAHEVRS